MSFCPLGPQKDIQEAVNWYNTQQEGLGKKFIDQTLRKVALLKRHPKARRIRYANTRTAVLDTFPYRIHDTIKDVERLVVIAAVLHTHRDPVIWQTRLHDARR